MPERRFSYWIAETLRAERERAELPIEHIAVALGVSVRTVTRLEDPEGLDPTGRKPYGRDIDRAVATYAWLLGYDDPRDLWQLALDRWRAQPAPDFTDEMPGSRFVAPIREAARAQRSRQARAGRASTRRAKDS